MPAEKTMALVLRVVEFSETSSVVTLFTEEFGKLSALAKGARRPKSPFEVALDLLALCRIVFLPKSGDALALLTEAKLERRFRGAQKSLSAVYGGYYIAELLQELTEQHDPHPELFHAAVAAIAALEAGEPPAANVILRFELAALRLLGHGLSLTHCAETGVPLELTGKMPFDVAAGGVLAPGQVRGKSAVEWVPAGVLKTLNSLSSPDDQLWRRVRVDARTLANLRAVLNPYLTYLLGRRPRLHGYLGWLAE